MTKFKAATCPNCGGDLQLPTNVESVNCMYCGTEIVVQDTLAKSDDTKDIQTLLSMADTALDGSNYEEACSYYNQILEIDLTNYYAWSGKAISAAWLSTSQNPRFSECKPAILNAFKNCPDDHKQELGDRICNKLGNVFSAHLLFLKENINTFTPPYLITNTPVGSIKNYDTANVSADATKNYDTAIQNVIKTQADVINILANNNIKHLNKMVYNFLSNAKYIFIESSKLHSAIQTRPQVLLNPWVDDIYRYAKENGYGGNHPKESEEVIAAKKSAEDELTWGCLVYILLAIIAILFVAANYL